MRDIELDLNHHCIETEIRRRHNAAISQYFKAASDKTALEETIDLLDQALRAFDFRQLRSRWPLLGGHASCRIWLTQNAQGHPELRMDSTRIVPPAEPA
ncbi:hypothetical protein [Desulfosarcina ovata]|uniref:Uncharacterized protein n=1 Tax=Desulfosarcina ovata subsp. ovata TaxID=2752305 RepID=A0A5K8AF49_9BACT|nr:hypothetical protein [Desulfosarcina ovata]BBO91108.1 hypothetical protein DSCOOX_42880 [Desulfosarcina ovata subsp. ovata]